MGRANPREIRRQQSYLGDMDDRATETASRYRQKRSGRRKMHHHIAIARQILVSSRSAIARKRESMKGEEHWRSKMTSTLMTLTISLWQRLRYSLSLDRTLKHRPPPLRRPIVPWLPARAVVSHRGRLPNKMFTDRIQTTMATR